MIVYAPELPPAMPERLAPVDRDAVFVAFTDLAHRLTADEWLQLALGCRYARRGDA